MGDYPFVEMPSVYDPGSFVAIKEIVVTTEMLVAGMATSHQIHATMDEDYAAIYRAMAALAPVPLVSDGELAAVKERNDARAELKKCSLDALAAQGQLIGQNISLHAELQAARDTIAKFTAANVETDPGYKPALDPILNAIRPRDGDRRMVGG